MAKFVFKKYKKLNEDEQQNQQQNQQPAQDQNQQQGQQQPAQQGNQNANAQQGQQQNGQDQNQQQGNQQNGQQQSQSDQNNQNLAETWNAVRKEIFPKIYQEFEKAIQAKLPDLAKNSKEVQDAMAAFKQGATDPQKDSQTLGAMLVAVNNAINAQVSQQDQAAGNNQGQQNNQAGQEAQQQQTANAPTSENSNQRFDFVFNRALFESLSHNYKI